MPLARTQYLTPLTHWSLWRIFCLRAAGFPAAGLLHLGCPELASAVDDLLRTEQHLHSCREKAIAACDRARVAAEPEKSRAFTLLIRRLKAGRPPDLTRGEGAIDPSLVELSELHSERERLQARLPALFERERLRVSELLRSWARDPSFREAVTWQNRGALLNAIEPLLRQPVETDNAYTRRYERLVANYLQRYCAKNDSIGFFGPIGWGTFSTEGQALSLQPGSALLSKRSVYFEHWAIDALASTLSEIPGIKPWLAPRRSPLIRLEGSRLHHPFGTDELPPLSARLLSCCDGERTPLSIARELADSSSSSIEQVLSLLEEFRSLQWITWTLEIPTIGPFFERSLRAQLERIEDASLRARALAPLEALEQARDAVARAAGDAAALERALAHLDTTFASLTGKQATRNPGETYAGRTLLVEDCQRDVELTIGPEVLSRLSQPLSLILSAGRWFSHHVAQRYRQEFLQLFRSMSAEAGLPQLGLLHFLPAVSELIPRISKKPPPESVAREMREYQSRWARLLNLTPGQRRIQLSCEEIDAAAKDLFAAPSPGWPTARYHSPDVMIAARGPDAIRRGDYLLVLGEMHSSSNTLEQIVLFKEHPLQEEMLRALELDLPEGRVAPTVSKEDAVRGRTTPLSRHPLDVEIEFDDARSWRPRSQTLPISELYVVEADGQLQLRTCDGRRTWDFIEALDLLLTDFSVSILPPAPHTPRVTLGDLVVCRETWRLSPEDLPFLKLESALERFTATRRWARSLDLPRFLFFKASQETKPCYLDLESPLYVDNFIKLARASSSFSVSEMLPSLEQTWLIDSEGRSYTSELRIVAVDPFPWNVR